MPLDLNPDPFLADPDEVARAILADAIAPPPPIDLADWAEQNIKYGENDPMPGPFRLDRFPMLRRILEVLSPEHPAREVAVRGSAQWGKTNLLNIVIGAVFDLAPVNTLLAFPTGSAQTEWLRSKFAPLRRDIKAIRRVFGTTRSRDMGDNAGRIETLDGRASLRLVSAGSPSDLSATTRKIVLMDDLAKWENTSLGDPEELARSRAESFDDAKIAYFSTAMRAGDCRITKNYMRGTQEEWHVPCPHCGTRQALTWGAMEPNLREGDPLSAYFTCVGCGVGIEQQHRADAVAAGEWVAKNPEAAFPSFHLWRAYFPFRDWGSLVGEWFAVKGDPYGEQTFYNDKLGLPYSAATTGPKWETLRDRAEDEDAEPIDKGRVPARHPILCIGIDCQDDRTEWALWAFGQGGRRHCVDYGVEPVVITDRESWNVLDGLLKRTWASVSGQPLPVNVLSIDGGAYTSDVWEWANRWPVSRVKVVKGTGAARAPLFAKMRMEGRKDVRARRARKRGYMLNVGDFKSAFYADLAKDDPMGQGFCGFGSGLGDLFYRGLVSEHVVKKRGKNGVTEHVWDLIEPSLRNEPLDTAVYADFSARICGWRTLSAHDWQALEAIADAPKEMPDLFDLPSPPPPQTHVSPAPDTPVAPSPKKSRRRRSRRSGFM